MARRSSRPSATQEESLEPVLKKCPACGQTMWADYSNHRTLVTMTGLVRLDLLIRRCPHKDCSRYRRPYRPEAEGALALPHHEFGLAALRRGVRHGATALFDQESDDRKAKPGAVFSGHGRAE